MLLLAGAMLAAMSIETIGQTRSIPIRWCIIEGAPAEANPGAVGEPDADNVAWRRHERPTDAIYIPQADVTLRSSLWNIVESSELNFPIIADQDTTDPDHMPGDVLQPLSFASDEWDDTYAACVQAWEDELEVDDVGIVAVIARRVVDPDGNPDAFAVGYFGARRVLLEDNAWSLCGSPLNDVAVCDAVDKTFGHEIGHTLPTAITDVTNTDGLRHTCDNANMMRQGRRDADGDNVLDNFNLDATATQVTGSGADDNQCTGDDVTEAIDQPAAIYAAAAEVPGCVNAGTNDSCGTQQSDVQNDLRADAQPVAIDLTSMRILESSSGTTRIVHEMSGKISPKLLSDTVLEYFAFLDLDGNPATGGAPADLGLATAFKGAELVTRVRVTTIAIPANGQANAPPLFGTVPTVWRFSKGEFTEVETGKISSRVNPIVGVAERFDGTTSSVHVADRVEITLPNAIRGVVAVPLTLQGLTRATTNAGKEAIDKLDDTGKETGKPFRLRFPKFPTCSVSPTPNFANGFAQVSAKGLLPDRGVHVVFGPTVVATGTADATGTATVGFSIPAGTTAGNHLVTIGTDKTALTADCIAEVTKAKIRYEYAAKLVCGVQPNTRSLRLARGHYATSINIHNPGRKARISKKLALTHPPGRQKPGKIFPLGAHGLGHDEAVAVDCDHIRRTVFNGRLPAANIEGFVVIQSTSSLDVEAVYSTATLNAEGTAEDHSSVVVRRVHERKVRAPGDDEPERKADLVVRDIDLASLKVSCPTGGGSCVTTVKVTIANIGTGGAGQFKTEVLLDPNLSVSVTDDTPAGLPAGGAKTFEVITPPGGNCFDSTLR